MESNLYQLYCLGSRGMRPVEGRRFNEFGGFTTCYILKKDDYALVIDCGTGLYDAETLLFDCTRIDVIFTHLHYDHILGLLDSRLLLSKQKVNFYASFSENADEEELNRFFRKPYNPESHSITLRRTLKDGTPLILNDSLRLTFYPGSHSEESQYIFIRTKDDNGEEHKIAVLFDNDKKVEINRDLIENCDYILFDGMYSDAEIKDKRPGRHSSWQEGCRLAARVNCGRLILTHHYPDRSDDELRSFERLARDIYPDTDFARSGQHWTFPINEVKVNQSDAQTMDNRHETRLRQYINGLSKRFDEVLLNSSKRERMIGIGSYSILAIVSAFMTIVNIFTGKTLLMYSTLIFAICCAGDVLLTLLIKQSDTLVFFLFQIEALCLLTFFLISGTPEGFSALWILLLPVGGMYVFGRKRTTMLCVIMMFIICFFLHSTLGRSYLMYEYTDSFRLRFPMAFTAFYALSFFIETVLDRAFKEITNLKNSQADIIADQAAELREQNYNMIKINAELKNKNEKLEKKEVQHED